MNVIDFKNRPTDSVRPWLKIAQENGVENPAWALMDHESTAFNKSSFEYVANVMGKEPTVVNIKGIDVGLPGAMANQIIWLAFFE